MCQGMCVEALVFNGVRVECERCMELDLTLNSEIVQCRKLVQ